MEDVVMEREIVWNKYDEQKKKEVFKFAEEYTTFISECKTERECVTRAISMANDAGYKDLADVIRTGEQLKAGDKVYAVNKNKAIILFCIGKQPMEAGMNILGAHIDSPRLDLKQNPLYEDTGLALLDTHYYGGIKNYQWVTIPLALHGVVALKNGESVQIVIGEDPTDPVVGISDLLIHLASKQMAKKGNEIIEGEDLNILIGSIPAEKNTKEDNLDDKSKKDVLEEQLVKKNILAILKEKYDIEEEDFLSAEICAVPAGPARDFGLDRSMILGYGHDDKVCAYPSLVAQLRSTNPEKTSVCILVDKEEIGSVGATGMHSMFFTNMVAEVMDRTGDYSELKLRRAMANSSMLSSDVTAAFDPNYSDVSEKKNSAYLGKGIVICKYTGSRGKSGSNDASAEYLSTIRKIFEDEHVTFQTSELGKVDAGGGGTIAYILANYDMNVVDSGIAVHSMHAPHELISKGDLYETLMGYEAFLKNA
jgi:aspartyl aminopeptidase